MERKTHKIEYIDKWTKGEKSTTIVHGFHNEDDIIKFYGLEEPDVKWYKITEIKNVL